MKICTLLWLLIYCSQSFCQKMETIDSTSVIFKANLFTTSEYGIASKENILKDIESQKVIFLKTKYKSFSFLKIEFSQPYRTSDISSLTLNRSCSYYLAFNIIKKRFYKLGGFDNLDIDDFINDLELQEGTNTIDWVNRDEIAEINIDRLYDYFKLNKKQRLKRKFSCFECCSQNTKTYYIEN